MKICVFSDVHGNLFALDNLFETEDFKNADRKIFLGDCVAMGAYPNECLAKLLNNDIEMLLGNHDSYVINGVPEQELPYSSESRLKHQAFIRNLVLEEYKTELSRIPKFLEISTGGKKFYFAHFLWEDDFNISSHPMEMSLEFISDLCKDLEYDYVIFGHEHTPFRFKDDNKEYIGVGSVGMRHPGHYCVIDIEEDGEVNITQKILPFDLEKLKTNMLEMNYPRVEVYIKFFNDQ